MCLALCAGYLDGYGLQVLGTFVSFMSGNTTTAGVEIAQTHLHQAVPPAIAVASFVVGSFAGNLGQLCGAVLAGIAHAFMGGIALVPAIAIMGLLAFTGAHDDP